MGSDRIFGKDCVLRWIDFLYERLDQYGKFLDLGKEKPLKVQGARLDSPGAMVGCKIRKIRIIGPYFFENKNLNGKITEEYS